MGTSAKRMLEKFLPVAWHDNDDDDDDDDDENFLIEWKGVVSRLLYSRITKVTMKYISYVHIEW